MTSRNERRSDVAWVGLTTAAVPVDEIAAWLTRPTCGAVVTFSGTARDHSDGRSAVTRLEFEAYEEVALVRLQRLAGEISRRFPEVERVAMVHRTGVVPIGESAVAVGASSAHRDAAFDAARFAIDALKATIPIWKREAWSGGESAGREAQHLVDPEEFEPHRGAGVATSDSGGRL